MDSIYRILYCSRNCIPLGEQDVEVRKILAKSRANNPARGVTGALLFNGTSFAQVLEGPLPDVEATFERIQRDLRHDEVTVLEAGYVASRDFPEWSMAFAGADENASAAFAHFNVEQATGNPTVAAAEIREWLRSLLAHEEEYAPA